MFVRRLSLAVSLALAACGSNPVGGQPTTSSSTTGSSASGTTGAASTASGTTTTTSGGSSGTTGGRACILAGGECEPGSSAAACPSGYSLDTALSPSCAAPFAAVCCTPTPNVTSGTTGGSSGTTGGSTSGTPSLIGTWDLTTTPLPGANLSPVQSTVVIGQDSLTITSPGFTWSITRDAGVLSMVDDDAQGVGNIPTTASQSAATFNAGILPFNIGGTWAVVAGVPQEGVNCSLSVASTEIDATCHVDATGAPYFSFTTTQTQANTSSIFGDFGGTWTNQWTSGPDGGPIDCELDFGSSSLGTCDAGLPNLNADSEPSGYTPVQEITFQYAGNTVSGVVGGWAEYSATRQ